MPGVGELHQEALLGLVAGILDVMELDGSRPVQAQARAVLRAALEWRRFSALAEMAEMSGTVDVKREREEQAQQRLITLREKVEQLERALLRLVQEVAECPA